MTMAYCEDLIVDWVYCFLLHRCLPFTLSGHIWEEVDLHIPTIQMTHKTHWQCTVYKYTTQREDIHYRKLVDLYTVTHLNPTQFVILSLSFFHSHMHTYTHYSFLTRNHTHDHLIQTYRK